jgi:uncharacterized protein
MVLQEKYDRLKHRLSELKSVVIAFSGGVDSTFLLKVAYDTLGPKAIAVTIHSALQPTWEINEVQELVSGIGAEHIQERVDVFQIPGFADNPSDRCYHCKKRVFRRIQEIAAERGALAVLDGTNADDINDFRPGMKAIAELGVLSPLKECGISKDDIRLLSKELGLPTWNKPSFACLASRIPYGQSITLEKLRAVEKAEEYLITLGYRQIRVRHHGDIARIELGADEKERFLSDEDAKKISEKLKEMGFLYVTLDLDGYRTGSLNDALKQKGEA